MHPKKRRTNSRFIDALSGKARQNTLGGVRRDGCFRQQGFRELGFETGGHEAQRIARRETVHVGEEGEQLPAAVGQSVDALSQPRSLVGEQGRRAGVVQSGRRLPDVIAGGDEKSVETCTPIFSCLGQRT